MPKITITPIISSYLKGLRSDTGITVRAMAESINKSPAYVSKLERGEIGTMDLDTMYKYVGAACKNDDIEIGNTLDYIYNELQANVSSTPDEIQELEAYENFDKVKRQIPVPQDLKTYIINEIDSINYSLSDVVEIINQNEDVPFLKNKKDVQYNKFYFINGGYSILLKFEYEKIHDILYKDNTSCPYLTMQALLYRIFRLKGEKEVNASILAGQTLTEYKFYSLNERHKNLGKEKTTEHDRKNYKIIQELLKALTFISDHNVLYANDRLQAMIRNINNDMGFALTYMTLDITSLKDISYDLKKEFLQKIKTLIEEYSHKEKESDKIQTFDV